MLNLPKKKRSLPAYPLVIIEWADASRISDGWIDVGDIPASYLHKCVSVGFLVSSNKEGKILIPTIADVEHPGNSHAYGGMLIPSAAIISTRILK
jgi:hypothetical protein